MAILEVIGGLADGAGKLYKASQELKHADLKLALADWMGQLAEARVEASKLMEENARLKSELGKARSMRRIRRKLVFRDGGYRFGEAFEGFPEGPFCQPCLDNRSVLNLMWVSHVRADMIGKRWQCPDCDVPARKQ